MQAHKLSSYNTELSNSKTANCANDCAERRVELVNGKPMLTTMKSKSVHKEAAQEAPSSSDAQSQFDFAGLAG